MDNKRLTAGEREAMRDLHRLGKVQPNEEAAGRAIQRAMVALERVPGDVRSAKGNGISIMHPAHDWRWWFWRLIMPTSVMAAAVIAMSVMTWVGPTQQVSAAELLERVIAAQKAYDGWVRIDINTAIDGEPKWERYALRNEVLGRTMIEFGGSDLIPADIAYIDTVKGDYAKYRSSISTFFISDHVPGTTLNRHAPINSNEMLSILHGSLIGNEDNYDQRIEEAGDRQWLIFTQKITAADVDPAYILDPLSFPQEFRIEIDRASSRLLQIQLQADEASPLRPLMRFTTQTDGVDGLDDLTLPAGTKIVDNRTHGELKELLDSVDGLIRDGIGIDTAILIRRGVSPYTGEMKPSGEITVMARDGKRWVSRSWRVGTTQIVGDTPAPLPEGWPEPTFEAVLKAVEGLPRVPQTYWSDGETVWYTDSNKTSEYRISPQAAWELFGPANKIWWGRKKLITSGDGGLSYAATSLELKPDRYKDGRVIVADFPEVFLHDLDGPSSSLTRKRTEIYYTNDPFPVPYRVEKIRFDREGKTVERFSQWNFDLTDTVMFRDEVRVPLRWTYTVRYRDTPLSTSYFHLIPCPDAEVPEEWFAPADGSE